MGCRGGWDSAVLEPERLVNEDDPKQMWERPPAGDLPGKAAGQDQMNVLQSYVESLA